MVVVALAYKGGIGKTTTTIHIAAQLSLGAPTIAIDDDPNKSLLKYDARAKSNNYELGFDVASSFEPEHNQKYNHVVVDTPPVRPGDLEDLVALIKVSDLVVVPSEPDAMSLAVLMDMVSDFKKQGNVNYKVLLTKVPPYPNQDGKEARQTLEQAKIPTFKGQVRRASAFTKAALTGQLVKDVPAHNARDCWADYLGVGIEILGAQ